MREFIIWIEYFLGHLPGRLGVFFRRIWFSKRFYSSPNILIGTCCIFENPIGMDFGDRVIISSNSFFSADGGSISVGSHSAFNVGVHINASCGGIIKIGRHCPIGPGVVMRTANHKFHGADYIQFQGHEIGNIDIGDDCWLGANSIVLQNVTIGPGAIIGAGAVVTRNIPSGAIAVGVPAKVIGFRNGYGK